MYTVTVILLSCVSCAWAEPQGVGMTGGFSAFNKIAFLRHSDNNRITMVQTLLLVLLLFCIFSCVLVDGQAPGFTFAFETENGIKRAFLYGSANFHGVYIYNTRDGNRHVVHFGGSERDSGPFVPLGGQTTSQTTRPPPVNNYPNAAAPPTAPPQASYGGGYGGFSAGYPSAPASGGGFGEGGGGGGGSQSIAPALVASATGGGLG